MRYSENFSKALARARALFIASIPLLAACSAGAPLGPVAPGPSPIATAPAPTAAEPPHPPLPAEPAGLVALTAPSKVCELAGAVSGPLELAGRADGRAFATVTTGQAKLTLGPGGAVFAEITTPGLSLRGLAPRSAAFVRARRWMSFGGVYFPGGAPLRIRDARDGKLVLDAPELDELTLNESARTSELVCADASLALDPDGALGREAPPAFLPQGKPREMLLKGGATLPISAEPGSPATGTFGAAEMDRTFVVNEQRGARLRIRRGRVAGWVDASALTKPPAASARQAALREAAQFGTLGYLNSSGSTEPKEPPVTAALVCTSAVRVLAELGPRDAAEERYLVGAIPAGSALEIVEENAELAYLAPAGLEMAKDARLAVPRRDLVGCAKSAPKAAPSAEPEASAPPARDAVDALDPEPGNMWGDSIGESFGAGGLGLTGIGDGSASPEGLGAVHKGKVGGTSSISIRQGAMQTNGRLPPEVIQRIVRQNFGRFRRCYENGLRKDKTLTGRVTVRFVIERSGDISTIGDGGSDMPDAGVVACVTKAFHGLSFPAPEGGRVTVVYPLLFNPGTPKK